jgi:hypothetical protein
MQLGQLTSDQSAVKSLRETPARDDERGRKPDVWALVD